MKITQFYFFLLLLFVSKISFAENCVIDPDFKIQTCIADQSTRYIAGLETFRGPFGFTGSGMSYNAAAGCPLCVGVDFWTNIDNVDRSKSPPIFNNTPVLLDYYFVRIPPMAGIHITRPANINAIFTFLVDDMELPDGPIGNLFALEIWGDNEQSQRTLIARRYITGKDLSCERRQVLKPGPYSWGGDWYYTRNFCSTRRTSGANVPPNLNKADGFDSELVQTTLSTPLKWISAELKPLYNGVVYPLSLVSKVYPLYVYSIELDVFW